MRFLTTTLALVGGMVVLTCVPAFGQQEPEGSPTPVRAGGRVSAQRQPDQARRFDVEVTPEMRRHSRILDILYFGGFFYGCAVLLLILGSGASRKIRDVAARLTKRRFLVAMIYFAIFSLVSSVLSLPLDFYSGYIVPHQFDLSNQNFRQWLWEGAKQLMIGIAIGAPLVGLALLAIRRLPHRWWLAIWLGSIPITVFLIVIQPVVIDPMFNKFEPLKNEELRRKLLDEASMAGIEGGRVYEVNKSKQTKTLNAYVNGIGPTKRIVMWDTLLDKMNEKQVLFVMAHEMGHYVMNHLWKGLSFTMGVLLFVLFAAQKIVDWAVARFGPGWGFASAADPAALPALFLVLSVVTFLLSPIFNGYSRRVEHQADVFALELTHENAVGAESFIKLAEDTKIDPNPNAFIEFWRYGHPALSRRIAFALSYRPWEEGRPNRAWRPGSVGNGAADPPPARP